MRLFNGFDFYKVVGNSMNPFLKEGNVLFCSKNIDNVKRGNVVVFRMEICNKYYVKRIVGLPGETVEIVDGTLLINNRLDEINKFFKFPLKTKNELENWVLGSDQYFVIGDNFLNSTDSRNYGLVNELDITCKMILKIC